jgi:UDP-N-acetylmuramate dehydrogenase
MQIKNDFSLKGFNTFGIDVRAKEFVVVNAHQDLFDLILKRDLTKEKFLMLGGGSNILFTKDFKGLLIKNEIVGIDVVYEDDQHICLRVGAGMIWHELVLYCIERGWGGLENLSLIPGTVGASPIQNIGAYGVEVKDLIDEVEGIDLAQKNTRKIKSQDCAFEYRSSIFKTNLKNKFLITAVVFKLTKQHRLHIEYGAIKDELSKMMVDHPTIRDVSNAVISIRQSKLPDPNIIGNAGSFFKNPVVSDKKLNELKAIFPGIVSFSFGHDFKLAAGWLIEHAGWKGHREGNVGCHEKQALVLVNYGNASGTEILQLAQKIQQSVHSKFGVELEMEVNVV